MKVSGVQPKVPCGYESFRLSGENDQYKDNLRIRIKGATGLTQVDPENGH